AFAAVQQDLRAVRKESESTGTQFKTMADAMSHVQGTVGELTDHVKAAALGFLGAQAVIGGVETAFHTLTEFVGDSIASFGHAELAMKKLTTALQAQGRATPAVVGHYNDLATQFQRTTVYSDDLINEMEALLV